MYVYLVSNSGGTFFGISQSTGHIRLVAKVDYETMSSPKEYVLTVHAIDGGTPIPKTVMFPTLYV